MPLESGSKIEIAAIDLPELTETGDQLRQAAGGTTLRHPHKAGDAGAHAFNGFISTIDFFYVNIGRQITRHLRLSSITA